MHTCQCHTWQIQKIYTCPWLSNWKCDFRLQNFLCISKTLSLIPSYTVYVDKKIISFISGWLLSGQDVTSGQDVKVDHNTIEHMKLTNHPWLNLKIYLKKAILMERWTYFVNQPRLNLKMSLEKASLPERYFVKLFCTIILKEGRDIGNLNSQYFRSTFSHIYLFGVPIRIHFSIDKLKPCLCVIAAA